MTKLYGGIEAGGTKFVCAVGTDPRNILKETRFPTSSPDKTIARCINFFQDVQRETGRRLAAVGIGSFGPLDPDPSSVTWGSITTTPKEGWANVDFAGTIEQSLSVPVGFDTDVNAAALAEYVWGAGKGLSSVVYLTVGTGIGGGAVVDGKLLHGLLHPEMGHMFIPRAPSDTAFTGICPFHGDCLEGLASGPAIAARWGQDAQTLPDDHQAWELEAGYLAKAAANLFCILSPQCLILGGGVMQRKQLFSMIRKQTLELLGDYLNPQLLSRTMDALIVPSDLGDAVGVLGALALAARAAA